MSKSNKFLYSVKLEGTNSDNEEDYLIYNVAYPTEGVHDILGADLPKKEQKWIRPTFPDFEKCSKQENIEIYTREIRRISNGVYFWNNGDLTYVTGVHYAAMVHWKLAESDTDYFKYTKTQRDIFYFMDMCVNDTKCAGGIVFSLKRLGKSEIMQVEMFVDALLSEKGRYTFQALNDKEAKENFAKTFYANQHLHESLPITKWDDTKKSIKTREKDNLIVFFRETLKDGIKWTAVDTNTSTDNIDFGVKPTKLSGIQGKKLKRSALDEFASLEKKDEMTLANWHSKALAQTTEDSGSKVIGKMWMIATAENIDSDSLEDAKQIWDDSAPNRKDANGFTPSGLKRMFIPFYLGGRGDDFLDEYGNPRVDKAIEFWENKMEALSDSGKVMYSHQNPRYISHVFNLENNDGLEMDVIRILENREKELRVKPQPKFTISKYNGEIIVTPASSKDHEGQFTIELFEHPQPDHYYRIGVDATATAKNSTNKTSTGGEAGKEKSKFGLVVHKITGGSSDQYTDVCNFYVRPEKRHLVEKVALLISEYYNKYSTPTDLKCRVYPERNASAGSTLTDLYEAEGKQKYLIRELKAHNTDRLQEKQTSAYGLSIQGNNIPYRTSGMNRYLSFNGHKVNSIRIIQNLYLYGRKNSDLADAYGVGVLACGNFDPEKQVKAKKEVQEQKRMEWQMIGGALQQVWV
jgi:hypothetical protein